MRIHTRTVWDIESGAVLADDSFEYSGPVALCDRSVQKAAGQNAFAAGATGNQYGADAGRIGNTIVPTLTNDISNPQGYSPQEKNNMLVAQQQSLGGAGGSIAGEAALNAERTRNSGSTSGILDQAARRTAQNLSQGALGVENKSADLAQQKRGSALKELEGLYGTDVASQLKAMGLQNEDLNTELQAGKSGWAQTFGGILGSLPGASKGPMSYV